MPEHKDNNQDKKPNQNRKTKGVDDKKENRPAMSQEEKYRRRVFLLEDTRTRLYK